MAASGSKLAFRAKAGKKGTDYSREPWDAHETDPALLKNNSTVRSFTTSRYTYPGIRVFYRRHPKADELVPPPDADNVAANDARGPQRGPLPLLVFVHGLGGSVAQFHPLLTSLTNIASCLAIDLPGCGASDFAPADWAAYSTAALAELWEAAIEAHRDTAAGQGVVLVGHSMGSSIAALLACKDREGRTTELADNVLALVATCPSPEPPDEKLTATFRKVLWIPTPVFDLWRAWDRRGGLRSGSVERFVGPGADTEARRLQLRFNNQSRSPVFRRMAWGSLPAYEKGVAKGGLPGRETWSSLDVPVFVVGGADDKVTPPKGVHTVLAFLTDGHKGGQTDTAAVRVQSMADAIGASAAPVDPAAPPSVQAPDGDAANGQPTSAITTAGKKSTIADITAADFETAASAQGDHESSPINPSEDPHLEGADPSTPQEPPPSVDIPPAPLHPPAAFEATILPSPAAHGLLYTPGTVRILAGLVSDFLAARVTARLSLGWQLQYLSREGKWDVKNLAKWSRVAPVSDPIAGIFRAMKTLREADELHCPREFAKVWAPPAQSTTTKTTTNAASPEAAATAPAPAPAPAPPPYIKDVIDISHDDPVYDPRGLERAGIRYHKFPTVSKIPPSDAEVDAFIALVDRTREQLKGEGSSSSDDDRVIGVHCHYGFNRTGYFIVCYLVERCGFHTHDAIEAFAKARPNGIRHSHFLDSLFVRYCQGLKKEEA